MSRKKGVHKNRAPIEAAEHKLSELDTNVTEFDNAAKRFITQAENFRNGLNELLIKRQNLHETDNILFLVLSEIRNILTTTEPTLEKFTMKHFMDWEKRRRRKEFVMWISAVLLPTIFALIMYLTD